MNVSTKYLIILSALLMMVMPGYSESFERRETTILQQQFSDYMDSVKNKIDKNWTPPDTLEKAHIEVKFKIDRFGELIDSEIIYSSGNELYDDSVLEALKKASPFENFPPESMRDYITVKYYFDTSLVQTDRIKIFVDMADKLLGINNQDALKNINLAIDAVNGDSGSYFLYAKRSKIKKAMGDYEGAEADFILCKQLKEQYDKKRIMNCKIIVEMDKSAFAYFYLANAYDIAGDYDNAIQAIDKAISLTDLNNNYKRYKMELLRKKNN